MIAAALTAFGVVFLAELPDKTMVASLVLTTHYKRPLAVWVGVSAAFAVHVTAAVLLGSLLSRLPDRLVATGVGVLFLVGAMVLWRSGDHEEDNDGIPVATSFRQIAVASGLLVLVAELGDLSQLATAGLASKSGEPLATAVGALLALMVVMGMAVTMGSWIERKVPLEIVRRTASVVFAAFGAWSLVTAIRG